VVFREREVSPNSIASVVDLERKTVNPLKQPGDVATVLCFVSTTCPTSNRYAPTLNAIYDDFSREGIAFYRVYSDPHVSDETIRKHTTDYSYAMPAVRDTRHELAKMTGARITPQVAVITAEHRLVYTGRIDDWFIALGKSRTRPTEHNLRNVLDVVIDGEPIPQASGRAVGCYIPDY
jgi:hypothetical protein